MVFSPVALSLQNYYQNNLATRFSGGNAKDVKGDSKAEDKDQITIYNARNQIIMKQDLQHKTKRWHKLSRGSVKLLAKLFKIDKN